ncbi:hypothetical protein SAMN05421771_1212 [Granulicella pectinivorans]|uniref:Uncharacterized protein n=1 Tax=Granulicella pectinivorans TaxID=474950 RepID=A0A1I6LSL5_9BACT|nr:hypothetical protein SAMN05421771_1212 [Granulicella pectinivorans]
MFGATGFALAGYDASKKLLHASLFAPVVSSVAVGQHPAQDKPVALSKPRPSAAAIQQWQGSKFIHFGFSQLGGVWQGKQSGNGLARTVILKEGSQTKVYVGADHILEFTPPRTVREGYTAAAHDPLHELRAERLPINENGRFALIAKRPFHSCSLLEDYFLALAKRLLISSQLTTLHQAAR